MPNIMARISPAELEQTGIPVHIGPPGKGEPPIIGMGEEVVSLGGEMCAVLDYFGGHHPGLATPNIGGKTLIESRRWRVMKLSDLLCWTPPNNRKETA